MTVCTADLGKTDPAHNQSFTFQWWPWNLTFVFAELFVKRKTFFWDQRGELSHYMKNWVCFLSDLTHKAYFSDNFQAQAWIFIALQFSHFLELIKEMLSAFEHFLCKQSWELSTLDSEQCEEKLLTSMLCSRFKTEMIKKISQSRHCKPAQKKYTLQNSSVVRKLSVTNCSSV